MTGLKIALSAVGAVGGVASTVTGFIFANTPIAAVTPDGALSGNTPVQLTLALVAAGVGATAVAAWKVSRAWSQMETRMARLEEQINRLPCNVPSSQQCPRK